MPRHLKWAKSNGVCARPDQKQKKYHRDNADLSSAVKEQIFEYEVNAYDDLEGQGIYIGNSRMVSEVETLDGIPRQKHTLI